jgi:acetyl esterase/lipase
MIGRAPSGSSASLLARDAELDDGATSVDDLTKYAFDPELAPMVALLPSIDITDPVAARRAIADFVKAANLASDFDRAGLSITDHQVPQTDGEDLVVRVYQPEVRDLSRAGLIYLHGGGFVMGSIDTEDMNAATLARSLGIVVASVEYRLAPENPYPSGLDDCVVALSWLHEQAAALGVDAGRIGVYGQSAGGGLAAAVALRARDQGGPPICFQYLGIPELDDRLDTPSMHAFDDTPMWNRPNAELSWRYYLGQLEGDVPCYAAPARAPDLGGLPPAYVCAMELDPLRDEAIDYASRLLQMGVPTELHVFPGTFHGSSFVRQAAVSRRGYEEGLVALRRGLFLDREGSG